MATKRELYSLLKRELENRNIDIDDLKKEYRSLTAIEINRRLRRLDPNLGYSKSRLYIQLRNRYRELGKPTNKIREKYDRLTFVDLNKMLQKIERQPYTKNELYKQVKELTDEHYNKPTVRKLERNFKQFNIQDLQHLKDMFEEKNVGYEFQGPVSKWRKYAKVGSDNRIPFPLISVENLTDTFRQGVTWTRERVTFRVPCCSSLERTIADIRTLEGYYTEPHWFTFKGSRGNSFSSTRLNSNHPIRDLIMLLQRYFETYGDDAEILEIIIVKPDPLRGAFGAGRSVIQFKKDRTTWSPESKENCLFQAIKVGEIYQKDPSIMTDQKRIVQQGCNLKYCVKPDSKGWSDYTTIQECCDHLKRDILLYNNDYEIEKLFKAKSYKRKFGYHSEPPIEILEDNGHMLAVIKNEYITVPPEVEEKAEDYLHDRIGQFDKINRKIMVFDLETALNDKNEHIPYAAGLAWRDFTEEDNAELQKIDRRRNKIKAVKKKIALNGVSPGLIEQINRLKDNSYIREDEFALAESREETKYQTKQFWGLDCIEKMMRFIGKIKNLKKFKGYTMYAHNGGKFDFNILLRNYLVKNDRKFYVEDSIEQDGAFIHLQIRNKKIAGFKLLLKDSIKIFGVGLGKITKDLKVKHAKTELDHTKITLDNYEENKEVISDYLEHDILGLLEALCVFNETVYKSINVDMTKVMTAAGLAKRNFYRNYYDKFKNPIYQLTKDQDRFIRESYFGGRCECFSVGEIQKEIPKKDRKIYYYDFTSLYPSMRDEEYPVGKPVYIKNWHKGMFGFVRCKVRTKDFTKLPIHGIKHNGKLLFPHFDNWTTMILFSEELDYDQYEYEFIEGWGYNSAKIMKEVWEDGFTKKSKAKEEKKPALANLYKLLINSTYGFFGLRFEDRDSCSIMADPSKLYELIKDGSLRDVQNMGGYYSARCVADLKTKRFNVGIAAAVTSYARRRLTKLINAVNATKKPDGTNYEVYYCDTDSIITNCPVEDIEELREEFIPDGTGKSLGSLKNEMTDATGLKEFDTCVIVGAKQYYLARRFDIDKPHIIKRLKGIPCKIVDKEIHYRDYQKLVKGNLIIKNVEYFSVPRMKYLDPDDPHLVSMKKGKKTVRSHYTKGSKNLDNIKIAPYKYSEV